METNVFHMKKGKAEKSIEHKYSKEQVATKAGENLLMAKTEEFLYKKMKNDIQICINLSRCEKLNVQLSQKASLFSPFSLKFRLEIIPLR